MQWIFATFINLILHFLEVSLKQSPPSSSNNNNPNTPPNDNHDDDDLQKAYKFLELDSTTTTTTTVEQLSKQYKKLSLRYHPDRNGGTAESVALFQKLGACRDLILQSILSSSSNNNQNGNNDKQKDEDDNSRSENNDDDDDDDDETDEFVKELKRRQAAQRRYREMQKAQERAMQEEMQRQQELQKEFAQRVKAEQAKAEQQQQQSPLSEQQQPEASHAAFLAAAQQQQQQKEDQQQSSSSSSRRPKAKPRYEIMEQNTLEIVLALRWNMPQVVLHVMNQELPTFAKQASQDLYFSGQKVTPQRIKCAYLTRPLDADGNTLLHYAVYFACHPVVNFIGTNAAREGFVPPILYAKNHFGDTALGLAQLLCAAIDNNNDYKSVFLLLESYLERWQQHQARTTVLPALRAAGQRLITLARHDVSLIAVTDTALSLIMSVWVFRMNSGMSLVALFITNVVVSTNDDDEGGHKERIPGIRAFAMHVCFCGIYKCMYWTFVHWILRFIRWEWLLLVTPLVAVVLLSS